MNANPNHDATYKSLNRTRLENIFHRLFSAAQIDLTIHDRFGHPVKPKEWFLVPLQVIDEAVQRGRLRGWFMIGRRPVSSGLKGELAKI